MEPAETRTGESRHLLQDNLAADRRSSRCMVAAIITPSHECPVAQAVPSRQQLKSPEKRQSRTCHRQRSLVAQSELEGRDAGAFVQRCSRRAQCMSSVIAVLAASGVSSPLQPQANAVTLEDVTPQILPAQPLTAREQAIIDIFERTAPAVVNVFDLSLQSGGGRQLSTDSPEGNGTGVVWDTQGHVVTNYHVLGSILKRLPQQRQQRSPSNGSGPPGPKVARIALLSADGFTESYDGYLVGTDRSKDLAVIQIFPPEGKVTPIQLGESAKLRVGQQCLAVGNPFGFDHSLTTGVISGLNRDIASPAGPVIPGGIQSDAAINPGNSGGPLLDSAGRMIGINCAIFTNTGASAGIGFAIPVDQIRRVVPQLIEYGQVVRPSLNIQVASDQVAAALKVKKGALVQSVPAGSTAAKAGLLPTRRGLTGVVIGDIILKVNDRMINKTTDLVNTLEEFNQGDKVILTVRRGQEDVQIALALEESSSNS